ncbi:MULTISPECIES: hypothetical protein [unclassified Paenibacillus]|uniref:hypothetical protein n=1 Tax=unclassified Paenibacillus TaxID=185978 RepID=UPI0003E1D1B3|nr:MULTISPECIES: hypothetical protein [unclassified Paenibacillus]ETT33914.1 hypothetical protein C162_30245 [Paenibacillus sp. FSL R7-269]OMF89508.1 hypothetical protein BK147_25265 [Paenibacillus sp. FSL R7-0337]
MNKLTGIWSVDCMYGPGAQGDERIIFQDNGFGWIEIMNWDSILIETFHWTAEGNQLQLRGERVLSNYEAPQSSDLNLEGVGFVIEDGDTPSGRTMPLLRFSIPLIVDITTLGLMENKVAEDYYSQRLKFVENKVGE